MVRSRVVWPTLIAGLAALFWTVVQISTSDDRSQSASSTDAPPSEQTLALPVLRSSVGSFRWPTREEWLQLHKVEDNAVTAEQVSRFREYLTAPAREKKRMRLECSQRFGEQGEKIIEPGQENLGCLPWKIERMISKGKPAGDEHDFVLLGFQAKSLPPPKAGKQKLRENAEQLRKLSWSELSKFSYADLKKQIHFENIQEARVLVKRANLRGATCAEGKMRAAVIVGLEDLLPNNEAWMLMQAVYGMTMNCLKPHEDGYERMHQRMGLLLLERGRLQEAVGALGNALKTEHPEELESTLFWLGFSASLHLGSSATNSQSNSFWDELEKRFPLGLHNMVARSLRGDAPLEALENRAQLTMSVYEGNRWTAHNLWAFLAVLSHAVGDAGCERALGTYLETGVTAKELGSALFAIYFTQNRGDLRQQIALSVKAARKFRWNAEGASMLSLLYPMPMAEIVNSTGINVDPALVWAVMRAESGFDPLAVSPAGAMGLMQIQPETAATVMRTRDFDLLDVNTNIRLGCQLLERSMRQYGFDGPEFLAAYNAGAGNLQDWMKRYRRASELLFLDLIPFPSTRHYVDTVVEAQILYSHLLTQNGKSQRRGPAARTLLPFIPSAERMRIIALADLDLAPALDALTAMAKTDEE